MPQPRARRRRRTSSTRRTRRDAAEWSIGAKASWGCTWSEGHAIPSRLVRGRSSTSGGPGLSPRGRHPAGMGDTPELSEDHSGRACDIEALDFARAWDLEHSIAGLEELAREALRLGSEE